MAGAAACVIPLGQVRGTGHAGMPDEGLIGSSWSKGIQLGTGDKGHRKVFERLSKAVTDQDYECC